MTPLLVRPGVAGSRLRASATSLSCGQFDAVEDSRRDRNNRAGYRVARVSLNREQGTRALMSEAPTPEKDTIETTDAPELQDAPDPHAPELQDEPYHGPDPEEDEKGDGSNEDQGT